MAAPATVVAGASIIVSSNSLRTTSNQPLSSNLRVSPAAASAHHSAMADARGSSSCCAIPVRPEIAIDILSFNSMRFPQIFYVRIDLKWSMAPPYNSGHAWRAIVIFPHESAICRSCPLTPRPDSTVFPSASGAVLRSSHPLRIAASITPIRARRHISQFPVPKRRDVAIEHSRAS